LKPIIQLYCYYTNPESTCRAQNSISSKRNALQRINNSKIIEYSLKKNFHIGNFNHDMLRLKSRILATGRSLPLKLYLNAYPLDNISLLNIFKLPFRNVLGHFLKIIGLYDLIKRNA